MNTITSPLKQLFTSLSAEHATSGLLVILVASLNDHSPVNSNPEYDHNAYEHKSDSDSDDFKNKSRDKFKCVSKFQSRILPRPVVQTWFDQNGWHLQS